MTKRTTREAARSVMCPQCHAQPEYRCEGLRKTRESCHIDRHTAAILEGAPVVTPPAFR